MDKARSAVVCLNQWADIIGLFSICGILSAAFFFQIIYYELPCPLCLLQRISFSAIGLGFIFNLYKKRHASNYGLIILFSLLGILTATRQVLLHILPGSGSYGPPLLGLHFYTWSDITFFGYLGFVAIVLLFFNPENQVVTPASKKISFGLSIWFFLLLAANLFTTFGICGLGICPADPIKYSFGM